MAFLDDLAKKLESPALRVRIGEFSVAAIQAKIAGGKFTPNAPLTTNVKKGSPPLSDRGLLVNSITYRTSADSVHIGTTHPGAGVNNYGGTIRAKKGFLLIPASSRTRTLNRRYGWTAKEVLAGLRADGYSVWRQGRAIFYRQKGSGSGRKKPIMVYILKQSVTIPKREFMKLTSEEVDALFEIIRS